MRKIPFLLIAILVFPLHVYASPLISSISGPVSNSQNITVAGLAFGAGPTIHKWDNFEGGAYGDTVSGWSTGTGVKYDNTNQRTNSTLSAYADTGKEDLWYINGSPLSTVYMTFWLKADYEWELGVDPCPDYEYGYNWKWIWSGYNYLNSKPYFSTCTMCSNSNVWSTEGITGEISNQYHTNAIVPPSDEVWERHELYIKESASPGGTFDGTADGSLLFWQQTGGEGNTFTQRINQTAITTNDSGYSQHIEFLALVTCCRALTPTWIDDAYIANSMARVEIGNNSIWANCTHREIQIPSTWSDSSITVTVNRGSFKNGDSAYLFVVDGDGNASNGYPITIGGNAPPSPPSGLKVVD
jgi:hypothetical protein